MLLKRHWIILPFRCATSLISNNFAASWPSAVNRRRKAALNGTGRHVPAFPTTLEKGMSNEAVDFGAGRGDLRRRERDRHGAAGQEGGRQDEDRPDGQEGQ